MTRCVNTAALDAYEAEDAAYDLAADARREQPNDTLDALLTVYIDTCKALAKLVVDEHLSQHGAECIEETLAEYIFTHNDLLSFEVPEHLDPNAALMGLIGDDLYGALFELIGDETSLDMGVYIAVERRSREVAK